MSCCCDFAFLLPHAGEGGPQGRMRAAAPAAHTPTALPHTGAGLIERARR
jgi:hypothetical protein